VGITREAGGGEMTQTRERDSAEYIASLCDELAELAKQRGFDTGAYLLRIAALEFSNQRAQLEQSVQK